MRDKVLVYLFMTRLCKDLVTRKLFLHDRSLHMRDAGPLCPPSLLYDGAVSV